MVIRGYIHFGNGGQEGLVVDGSNVLLSAGKEHGEVGPAKVIRRGKEEAKGDENEWRKTEKKTTYSKSGTKVMSLPHALLISAIALSRSGSESLMFFLAVMGILAAIVEVDM